ncbi:MAG: A/G-specific adenine glycosylase [Alicyclobacillaceae bacterium]|nr:A/G-specific adenine glycosylase [Alicyclobacillaceae bacterium]
MGHILVTWYLGVQRPLPWRSTRDPYAIWVSETMLQQTRVEAVIPYYHRFLEAFPTVAALAAASEEAVLKLWQGLGYYTRARNLHRAAQQVVREHGGVIPDNPESFARLPGVGPYTCGAVMSIAFGRPEPAVDGNVLRVMARCLGVMDPVDSVTARRRVGQAVRAMMEEAAPGALTQALMELGALVCVPRTPRCAECPLADCCYARRAGLTGQLPVRRAKPAPRPVDVAALWWQQGDRLLLQQRRDSRLLRGMWQLPAVELELADQDSVPEETAWQHLRDAFAPLWRGLVQQLPAGQFPAASAGAQSGADGMDAGTAWHAAERRADAWGTGEVRQPEHSEGIGAEFAVVAEAHHEFSHLRWRVRVFRPVGPVAAAEAGLPDGCQFVRLADLQRLPLAKVYDKLVARLLKLPLPEDPHKGLFGSQF